MQHANVYICKVKRLLWVICLILRLFLEGFYICTCLILVYNLVDKFSSITCFDFFSFSVLLGTSKS